MLNLAAHSVRVRPSSTNVVKICISRSDPNGTTRYSLAPMLNLYNEGNLKYVRLRKLLMTTFKHEKWPHKSRLEHVGFTFQ